MRRARWVQRESELGARGRIDRMGGTWVTRGWRIGAGGLQNRSGLEGGCVARGSELGLVGPHGSGLGPARPDEWHAYLGGRCGMWIGAG